MVCCIPSQYVFISHCIGYLPRSAAMRGLLPLLTAVWLAAGCAASDTVGDNNGRGR